MPNALIERLGFLPRSGFVQQFVPADYQKLRSCHPLNSDVIFIKKTGDTMNSCMILGDISSDSASDQYPSVIVCDDCVSVEQSSSEESQIVTVSEYDPSLGDACEFCGKTAEEEAEEKAT